MRSRKPDWSESLRQGVHAGDCRAAVRALSKLEQTSPPDVACLLRFHEALLFLRAYPPSVSLKNRAERLLRSVAGGVRSLRLQHQDFDSAEEPEVSGISGTGISAVFSYGIARDLSRRHGHTIDIDWDYYNKQHHLGRVLPRFLPLLEEDSAVEAVVPYRQWLSAASGNGNTLAWLMKRLAKMPNREATEIYDSLELMLRWEFLPAVTRTLARLPAGRTFCHTGPLLRSGDIRLPAELEAPPLPIERLSVANGRRVLELMRDNSAVRYRELHGFTFGDPRHVFRARAGRGVEIYLTTVHPEHRLPLRAYHGGMYFKNGVPVGYVEGLSLFERMEVGFNLYYTFREGETAWLYARTLRLFRQLLNIQCFSIDPYQIGFQNKEAIESGAFWFYRKLGFRPVGEAQAGLCRREERRMERDSAYRSSPRVLKRLATHPVIYETVPSGDWDRFAVRNIGLAVQRRLAGHYGGDPDRQRRIAGERVARLLQIDTGSLSAPRQTAFHHFASILDLEPEIARWSAPEKQLGWRIIRSKAESAEALYLRLLQRHAPMRALFLRLGSHGAAQ